MRVSTYIGMDTEPATLQYTQLSAASTRGTQAQPLQSGPPSHQMFRLALGQVHLTISKFGRRESLSHPLSLCEVQDTGSRHLHFRLMP